MFATNGIVYILTNFTKTTLYIGVTSDLSARIFQHRNNYTSSFSSKYNTHFLIYYELYHIFSEAIIREKQLKKWSRIKKEYLINIKNPTWRFLNDEIESGVYSLLENY